jgi:hypothetical protein
MVSLVSVGTASASRTWTETVNSQSPTAPRFYYPKASPLNTTLIAYISHGWTRYRIAMRGGSGNGSTNECATNAGWLPDGNYNSGGGDPGTRFDFYRKTGGQVVVRGWVWYLGDRRCHNGTWRTELFIHSNGIEGTTWDGSYAAQGCIKISQIDRGHLANRHNTSSNKSNGTLHVY